MFLTREVLEKDFAVIAIQCRKSQVDILKCLYRCLLLKRSRNLLTRSD